MPNGQTDGQADRQSDSLSSLTEPKITKKYKKIKYQKNTKNTRQGDGLIFYMDDGGYFDFIEIKLVSGALR